MTTASATSHVYVGAARATSATRGGIFRKTVGEERWTQLTTGLPEVTQVQAIVVHPTNPDVVYLGTRSGLYRSSDRGLGWERLDFPRESKCGPSSCTRRTRASSTPAP